MLLSPRYVMDICLTHGNGVGGRGWGELVVGQEGLMGQNA